MDKIIYFNNKEEFTTWLEKNPEETELWLGYYKKNSSKNNISWSDSVDVALCFGWIDGIRKKVDEDSYKIRFTPRKPNSVWSALNVKKVKELIKEGKIREKGLELFNNRKHKEGYSAQSRNIELDKAYEKELKANKKAWEFFNNLAPSYKRDSIWWVMSAKKEETRIRRLKKLIECSRKELKIPILEKFS